MTSSPIHIATIGYEGATVDSFLDALRADRTSLLVDVRALAMSRRPGFAKSRLTANLAGAGVAYLHLRGLGTPADGRAAARAGKHQRMHEIFREHMATSVAQADLATLRSIVESGRRVCLLCFDASSGRARHRKSPSWRRCPARADQRTSSSGYITSVEAVGRSKEGVASTGVLSCSESGAVWCRPCVANRSPRSRIRPSAINASIARAWRAVRLSHCGSRHRQ
ncbi:MAG: DUF488 domain-containing protein [Gemmatimonadota bacterium]|nr:DUF488 domain-containing protein [Gemmatimonadota bacterium]